MNGQNNPFSFEQAYTRLEQVLEKMNSGKVSLDESLKLFEEADGLIASCNKKLVEAEQKIEILVKGRNGELIINDAGQPVIQEFNPSQQAPLASRKTIV
jgi:exodeoxyribonuclease VII small subunit